MAKFLRMLFTAIAAALLTTPIPVLGFVGSEPHTRITEIVLHTTGGADCKCKRIQNGRCKEYHVVPVQKMESGSADAHKKSIESMKRVAVHYIVGSDGKVLASTPEGMKGQHVWRKNTGRIGIEIANSGDRTRPGLTDKFERKQCGGLARLVAGILERHNLKLSGVKGHSDLDTRDFKNCPGHRRKTDPGSHFDWKGFRRSVRSIGPKGRFPLCTWNTRNGSWSGNWKYQDSNGVSESGASNGTASAILIGKNRIAISANMISRKKPIVRTITLPRTSNSFVYHYSDGAGLTGSITGSVVVELVDGVELDRSITGTYQYVDAWSGGRETGSGKFLLSCQLGAEANLKC